MGFLEILGGAGSIGDTVVNGINSAANLEMQRKNYEYMKWAQGETWKREDNAVQRRAADLVAAGMSPVLAAGGAASASGPISLTAPQGNVSGIDLAGSVRGLIRNKASIAESDAAVAAANAAKAEAEQREKNAARVGAAAVQKSEYDAAISQWDYLNRKVDNEQKLLDLTRSGRDLAIDTERGVKSSGNNTPVQKFLDTRDAIVKMLSGLGISDQAALAFWNKLFPKQQAEQAPLAPIDLPKGAGQAAPGWSPNRSK